MAGADGASPQGGARLHRRNRKRDPHGPVRVLDVATPPHQVHLFEMCEKAEVPQGMGCRVGSTGKKRLVRRMFVGRHPGRVSNQLAPERWFATRLTVSADTREETEPTATETSLLAQQRDQFADGYRNMSQRSWQR